MHFFFGTNKLVQAVGIAVILTLLLPAISTGLCMRMQCLLSRLDVDDAVYSSGLTMALTYNYMDQRTDWSGWNSAATNLNSDKEIRTSFYTLGLQYMESRDRGMMIEIPVWDRFFTTAG